MFKKEADLIKALNQHLYTKYGKYSFAYHTHSSGYGESGFPDLVLFHNGKIYLIECKKDISDIDAIKHLRPSQPGMIEKICWSDNPVYILFSCGLMKKEKNKNWVTYWDSYQFSAIDTLLEG